MLVILGDQWPCGAYVLRIHIEAALCMAFGRFMGGTLIRIPAGEALYVGSAMGRKGATTLARRLVRHATRSGSAEPHAIRNVMLKQFPANGLGTGDLTPKTGKHPHWHVDYLLDHPAAVLTGAIIARSEARLEAAIAQLLADDPQTQILAAGLGAGDAPGCTHLLRVIADEAWWDALPGRIERLLSSP